jgi:senataxin
MFYVSRVFIWFPTSSLIVNNTTISPHVQLMQSAHVIFCTLASAGGGVLKKATRIDDLIVDEAAAATEPELYIPFHLQPQRLLVVGDPLQLPATVLSRRAMDLGLAKSLHERLMFDCKYDHVMLNIQYRMHSEISAFPSERFYQSKIGNGPNVTSPNYGNGAILLNRQPYAFLQVEGREEQIMGGSYQNRIEAEIIVELISTLQNLTESSLSDKWCGTDRIRVITFYQAQVACIEQCLSERGLGNTVVVATVDSSQGCEADIVLISFVRSQRDEPDSEDAWSGSSNTVRISTAGFLNDDRRMNVALTRAKYQLICVGNVQNFHRIPNAPTLHLLAKDAKERGIICIPPPKCLYSENSEVQALHPAFKKFRRCWNKD